MLKKTLLVSLAFALIGTSLNSATAAAPASQATHQGALKGRVEQRNAATKVVRPAMPSSPLGDALDGFGKSKGNLSAGVAKKDSPVDVISKSDFQFQLSRSAGNDPAEKKAAAIDSSDQELVIEWDAWHKRVSEAIQHNWNMQPSIPPGDASVSVEIKKNGSVHYSIVSFKDIAGEEFYHRQKEDFEAAVSDSLRGVEFHRVLNFPKRSLRQHVAFTARFSNGADGHFSWKHGDVERIPSH